MGKRERRRKREGATAPTQSSRPQLGAPGPYMVCGLCGEPVNRFTSISPEGVETEVGYNHNLEYTDNTGRVIGSGKDYGHEALAVMGNPVDANGTCDFCHAPTPRWVFVPRRPIVIRDSLTGIEQDYSSPWSCCDECLPAVKARNITRILNRAISSRYSEVLSGLSPAERNMFRSGVRLLYSRYLKSAPSGPYELKIRPQHKPVGRRGSARGV